MSVEFNYTAMAAALANAITPTQLNALGIDAITVIGDAIEVDFPGDGRDFYIKFQVDLGSVNLVGELNPVVKIYMIEALNDADYEDAWANPSKWVATIGINPTNEAHKAVSRTVIAPNNKAKFLLENKTGVAFETSDTNNTLKYRVWSEQSN